MIVQRGSWFFSWSLDETLRLTPPLNLCLLPSSVNWIEKMGQLHNIERFTTPPEISDIESLAREAYAHMPDELRDVASQLKIEVQDFPSEYMMEAMDCETPFEILGLYQGVDRRSMTQQSRELNEEKDTVFLFRRPILDFWCENGEDLNQVVRHVLIHEIGHYFGMSEDDMDKMESRTVSLS